MNADRNAFVRKPKVADVELTNGHERFGAGAGLGDANAINRKHPHLI